MCSQYIFLSNVNLQQHNTVWVRKNKLCIGGHWIKTFLSQFSFVSHTYHIAVSHSTSDHSNEVIYFLKNYDHISLYNHIYSGTNVTLTLQVCVSAMLVLLTAEN